MKQSNNKNPDTNNHTEQIESVDKARPVHTFIDDVAKLKKDNKLTQKDISQIAPNIIDKVDQLDETRNKKESLDQIYQEVIKQEDEKITQDIPSLSPQIKAEVETKISRPEEITQNIEAKYFSEKIEQPKPTINQQQETSNLKANETNTITDKYEEKKKEATPYEKIENEKAKLEEAILAIQKEKEYLETKEAEIKEEKNRIELENKSRKELETEIEEQENELRKQKNEAGNVKERQELEKKRQNKEDERQQIETERWNADQNIADLKKQIDNLKKDELIIVEKEARNKAEIQKLERKQLLIRSKAEKLEIIKKLTDAKKMRAELETEWNDISNKIKATEDEIVLIGKRKNIIETEIQTLEGREHKAVDPTEIHKIEEARWEKDRALRGLEEESLITEEKKAPLEESLIKIETQSREVIHTEQEMLDKLSEIDRIISTSEQDIKTQKNPKK